MKIPSWLLYTVLLLAVVIPLVVVIWVGSNGIVAPVTFQSELLKASLNLLLIGVLGMLAKELWHAHSSQKIQKEQDTRRSIQREQEVHSAKIEVLNRLTANYWGVKKALHLIMAHKSARSYKEQMHLIIDYRLALQQLNNEVLGGEFGFKEKEKISNLLAELDKHINQLVDEWTENHLHLAWRQKEDEVSSPDEKKVPSLIEALPELRLIWKDIDIIHQPFQKAADLIRKETFF